ncbi:phosphoribosyltransferase [Arthrobacter sulfonylureivorans]|uniref:Phosphoribosyl transferase n=1 Tax=Arthrobacter sulfonylureivorans TaxID=2486855 RepID=A0ABY3WA99_9MICC|nr:phosphoribosyltransferase family protein [Arthrobacter sulfonylureivorans]UNK47245.1 phosphoribosyl transferase [Arthrobacter sulfonylureivorans]
MGLLSGTPSPFVDRSDAAHQLAAELADYRGRDDVVVLGLARGGVPVAAVLAKELAVDLDALIVRKLGIPDQPEVAFGALAAHGGHTAVVMVDHIVAELRRRNYSEQRLQAVQAAEGAELQRRQEAYLHGRTTEVGGRTAILCDDGLATGATMKAAIKAVRQSKPRAIVVAVPVGPPQTCAELEKLADAVVCLRQPRGFRAVGEAYRHFNQVSDDEVLAALPR